MKSKTSQTDENSFSAFNNRFQFLFLTAAIVLTGAVFVLLVWHIYLSDQNAVQARVVKAAELRGSIIHLEEVFTMSAKMAAATGDARWEAKYRAFEPQLKRLIGEAKYLLPQPDNFTPQTDAANQKLVEMENRAFAAARENRLDEAREILFSEGYEHEKKIYSDGINAFGERLEKFQKAELEAAHSRDNFLISAIVIIFALAVFAWLTVMRNLQKLRQTILPNIAEKEKSEAALKDSEQYRNLFRHANDAILIFEPDTEIILEVNDKACEIYDRRRADFVGRSLKDFSRDVPRGTEELKKLLRDGFYQEFESVHLRGDGAPLDLVINAAVIEYQGKPAILTINRDVTHKKQIEENLRESEEQFRSVTNSARDAIISADSRGNVVFWNKQAEKIFGFGEDEMIGQSLQMIMPAAHRQNHPLDLERNVRTGENLPVGKTVEVSGRRKDGTEFPLELSLGTWESAKGKFFTVVLRDITHRKQAEIALQKSERQYRLLGEGIKHQIWTSAPDGKLDYVNQRTLDYFGFSMEEVINDGWMNVVHPEELPICVEKWTLSLETGEDYEVEFRLRRADGKYLWHLGRATAGRNEAGEIVKWLGTNSEIESQKSAEKNLQQNLSVLTSTLESTADGILVVGANNKIVTFNEKFAAMWGMTAEELNRMPTADAPQRISEQINKTGDYYEKTKRIDLPNDESTFDVLELKDGRIYERYSQPQRLTGEIVGRVFSFRDITERKRAEENLRDSRQWLRAILDGSRDGIVIEDDGIITYVNQAYLRLLQYERPEDLMGKCISTFLPPEEAERLTEYGRRRLRGERMPTVYEFKAKRKDGSLVEVEGSVSTTRIGDKKYIMTAVRDITQRKLIREELEESEQRYRLLFESNPNPIFVYDIETLEYLAVNEQAVTLYGYTREEFAEITIREIRPPEDVPLMQKFIAQADEGVRNFYSVKHRKKDGTIIEANIAAQNITFKGKLARFALITDVTERTRAENALRESEERFRSFMNNNPSVAFLKDADGKYVYINETMERAFDFKLEDMLGKTDYDWLPEEVARNVCENDRKVLDSNKIAEVLETIPFPDGSERRWLTFKFPVKDASGNNLIGGTAIDITDRERDKLALSESEYKLRTLVENMNEGLIQVDEEEVIKFVNDRFCEMIGYRREELLGKTTFDILPDEEAGKFVREINRKREKGVSSQYELRLKTKSGENLWTIVGGVPVFGADGEFGGTMGVVTDITERKRAEEQLQHDAFHDGLTGLPNRALFMDHLQRAIERGKSRHSNFYAVLFLDFDRFKGINDSLGHSAGDDFLKAAARRLEHSTRGGDLVARLGGDEFVVLLTEMLEADDAAAIAGRTQEDLKKPFKIDGREIFVSASIGIALSTSGHTRAEDMLRDADIAMYRAKAKGRARYEVFDAEMREQAAKQLSLETEMRHALEREEFQIHYQPVMNLENETLTGFEALVRWRHPTHGIISPFEFIPAAEDIGLILPLGQWILEESCRQLHEWQRANPAANLTVSVNLSSKQFAQTDLTDQIAATLEKTGLAPHCLKLEITESHVMENSEQAIQTMNDLRALGCELSLDDFGTGYSSLSYLHRLPANFLKIDRSFVMRMSESKQNAEIVSTIIKLAQNLKMKVIAEGIETKEQLARLKRLKCEFGQGYLFSKPLEAKNAEDFIERTNRFSQLSADESIINLDINV